MSDLIELNFRNARKQAEVLERLAQRLKTISEREYEEDVETVCQCWKGENAEILVKKMRDFQKTLSKSARDLDRAGKTVCKIAKTSYDADRTAEAIARIFTG